MVRLLTVAVMAVSLGEAVPAPTAHCVRLSGAQIGQLPLTVELEGRKVEFVEWKATDITAHDLIGFTAQATGSVRFTVRAGDREFAADANWIHPAGVVGPHVQPISAVTVCAAK